MICKLTADDFQNILNVVNDAAIAYKDNIPIDRWKTPYMTAQELKGEIQSGVEFFGWKENKILVAVMGIQRVNDVTLIRHAYTLTISQRKGLGENLLEHLLKLADTKKVYVGTWEAAGWAIKFYEKHGFELVSTEEKNKLLKRYWSIPERQVETSVVLELKRQAK
ncbi:MAG TPA: GNAT family N-acetyltransferase [Candidatus Acidoferrum sp.]|nr:GNAT family N-acetyltransferase [Candidatus Acidoferrum sp.]